MDSMLASLTCASGTLQLSQDGAVRWTTPSGAVWKSTGPLVNLRYYDRCHPCAMEVSAPSGRHHAFGTAGTPSLSARGELHLIETTADTIRILTRFVGLDIELPISLELMDEAREFRVTLGEIRESSPQTHRALSVEILPFFGAAPSGDGGSMVLPNWSGTLAKFDKTYPRYVRQVIYSSNDEWANNCNAPVWGISHHQGTLCGLIAEGDCDARLVSYLHYENEHLNGSHPELVYRWEQQDELVTGPRQVRYSAASLEEQGGESYAFCARQYQNFLRQERGVQTWVQKAAVRPEATDYLDRFFLKIFMAYKDPKADGQGEFHPVTTFVQAQEIIRTLLDMGLSKLSIILVGWGQDGHDGMRPTQFPVDERLGGEAGLRDVSTFCHGNDILLGVHDGYGVSYPCSPEHDLSHVIRHRTGEHWAGIVWSGGQAHMLCPHVFVDRFVKRDMKHLHDLGLHGHHHIDAIGSFMTCHSPDHPLEKRADFIAKVAEMFQCATETFGGVSTEYPYGPYLPVVDGFYHSYESPSPWHRATEIGRYFLDETVPLIPLALHGSHNCQSGLYDGTPQRLLRQLAWGLSPQSEVSMEESAAFGSPTAETKFAAIKRAYDLFYGEENLWARTSRLEIDTFEILAPDVTRTRYTDGSELLVNASEEPFEDMAPLSHRFESASQEDASIRFEAAVASSL